MTASQAPEAVCDGLTSGTPQVGLLPAQPAEAGGGRVRVSSETSCALRGRPESVKLARDFARETLTAWGLSGLCDDVTSVISELVTNALNHGLPHSSHTRWARPIRVCLTLQLAHVLCMVSDPGAGLPVRKEPDYLRECGRGLHVVEACSDNWGWNLQGDGGKVIWAAFRIPG